MEYAIIFICSAERQRINRIDPVNTSIYVDTSQYWIVMCGTNTINAINNI